MIVVKRVEKDQWKELSVNAHIASFSELWDADIERISYALLMVQSDDDVVAGFATVQDIDAKTAYLQYGGVFERYKNTAVAFRGFHELIKFVQDRYDKIITLVENKNFPMLKFYMKEGFLVTGIRYFKDRILLENTYEFIH